MGANNTVRAPGRTAEALPLKLLAVVWLPFSCGYFLSYAFRTINAIISQDLVRDLGLAPGQLGLLTAAYFFTFALAQIPLGVLLDRFGPRRIETVLLLLAAAGAGIFSAARGIELLVMARALIGVGVSACLMAAIKSFVQWFPMSRLASVNGWLLACGGLGAFATSLPAEAALRYTDWRGLFAGIALLSLLVAALIFFVVPDRHAGEAREGWQELFAGVRRVFGAGVFWRVSLVGMVVQGTFLSVQTLWIAPWLRDVAGYESTGGMLAAVAVAMIAGFGVSGSLSDRLARRGIDHLVVLKASYVVAIAMFALIAAGVTVAVPLIWVIYGSCSATAITLSYPILSMRFPAGLAGRVNTANNMLVFVWAFVSQWGMGAVIGLWTAQGGHYALAGYRAAFGLCLLLQIGAFVLLLAQRK
jgi:MFS family permease